MSDKLTIQSEVPFGKALYEYVTLRHQDIAKIATHNTTEQRYLAWETVRRQTNPYFFVGTGFEGYFVGLTPDQEAALEAILGVGKHILESIARLYRFEYDFKSRLIKTLNREIDDPFAIHIWSAYLGAELGRLRCQVSKSEQAKRFRMNTYQLIKDLPQVAYQETQNDIMQTYAVGSDSAKMGAKFDPANALKPCEQDAWLVVTKIGQFGHPLVRQLLDK